MGEAMGYEFLIRKAFGCGRFEVAGADADIYRRFERKQSMYEENLEAIKQNKTRTWGLPIEEMAEQAGFAKGKVVAHINNALYKVIRDYEAELSDEQMEELNKCSSALIEPTREDIDDVLEKAHKVFTELNLQAS